MNRNLGVIILCLIFISTIDRSTSESLKDISFAKKYLKKFHYTSPLQSGNHDYRTSLELFQRYMHLPVTGNLDDDTIKEMRKPRCGFPDIEDYLETTSPHSRNKSFAVGIHAWNRTELTYGVFNTGNDMTADQVKRILKKAFKIWSDKTVLSFTYQADVNVADIKISFGSRKHGSCFYKFDGPGHVLAHAFYPPIADIHIDDDEHFTEGSYSGTNLLALAVHEIGHVIGIGHCSEKDSIMNPQFRGYDPNLSLHPYDIKAVAHLYGEAPETKSPCVDDYSQSVCGSYNKLGLCSMTYIKTKCRRTCRTPGSQC